MKLYFLFSAIFVLLISCGSPRPSQDSEFIKIKELEFARSADIAAWQELYSLPEHRYTVVQSISKIKNPVFNPFLKEIITRSTDDSLRAEAIFAIGQSGSADAENVLLTMPFSSFSLKLQKALISALSHCGSERSVRFFKDHFQKTALQDALFRSSAILARRTVDVSSLKEFTNTLVSAENLSVSRAYFLYNTVTLNDVYKIAPLLSTDNVLSQKYLLRAIQSLAIKKENALQSLLVNDSTLFHSMQGSIFNALDKSADWKISYYAMSVSHLVADSTFYPLLEKHSQSAHLFLKIASLEKLMVCFPEKASSKLLTLLRDEKGWFLKGELLKILAGTVPEKAYPLIIQNLDKGDSYYKAALLDALALIEQPLAIRKLAQFVNVQDQILANRAFENLNRLRKAKTSDFKSMYNSDAFSSVALALEWAIEKKVKVPLDDLLKTYQKFSLPINLEVQRAVLKAIDGFSLQPDSTQVRYLFENSGHHLIYASLKDKYTGTSVYPERFPDKLALLPEFLQADSINYYDKNPVVTIETSKGTIVAELYSDFAPLTTHNFLKLAQSGFYRELFFHRVIADFVIQGGDPLGDGWGGPQYLIPSEDNSIPFKRGSIGIATAGFDTGGSQLFICQSEQPHLTGNYTLFGQVTHGLDVVDNIVRGDKILNIYVNN